MKIQIINGPNLNLLGQREPGIYGSESFEVFLPKLQERYPDIEIDYYQSNVEGELINKMQEVGFTYDGIVLNAGAYTHTSIEHNAIVLEAHLLHLVDELALHVALIVVYLHIRDLGFQLGQECLERLAAIDARLANTQQVQVGSVNNLNLHCLACYFGAKLRISEGKTKFI